MEYKNDRSKYMSEYDKRRRETDPEYLERRRRIARESAERNKPITEDGGPDYGSRYANRKSRGVCTRCGSPERPLVTESMCQVCSNRSKVATQKYRKALFDHYGWQCRCCGEDNPFFLTIDHINNDGHRQRKERRGQQANVIVQKARKTGQWPEDLQTLCFNCNCGRNVNGGICPHQIAKSAISTDTAATS